ncbi:hypothetical protein [Venatoribacter cucullus]|uniref:hypothetical protein n=1 Tax=Venatoribacter cucullus TaxID=2661630 RepID=UPI00223F0000|nr:hypothetical protein [Venatoribacter cucullus]UZK02445.1 hypothetical protein GAY96_00305 [Venatoribacter cucullus]
MFKPSDLNTGAWIREGQLRQEARVAQRNAAVQKSNLNAWKQYAWELEARNESLLDKCNNAVDKHNHLYDLLKDTNEAGMVAGRGVVVAGYTNNMAMELLRFRFQLMAQLTDGNWNYAGLAFGKLSNRHAQAKQISFEDRQYINLRLLCRMEWFDWCLHNEVMAKFGAMVTAAMLNPTPETAKLRGRRLLDAFVKESSEYHALRERAMNYEESEAVRDAFEQERFDYWNGRIVFGMSKAVEGRPFPSSAETRKLHPDQRFDLHLPAGRLARDFGINIATGDKADCYREGTAALIFLGYGESDGSTWYY